MLESFRSLSNSLFAKLLLGFLVLCFGIWGVGDMLRSPSSLHSVAKVGGLPVSSNEYQRALHREMEQLHSLLGDRYSPELMKSLDMEHQVLQKLIDQNLLRAESQSMGLIPSDADIVHRIRSNPDFQDRNGNFDKEIFARALQNANISEKTYVTKLREELAASLLMDTLLANIPVHSMAFKTLLETQEEQRAVSFYRLTTALVPNIPAPSDADIQSYYKDHASEFTAPEYRTVSYVTLQSDDVRNRINITDEELHKIYDEHSEDFKKPELRIVEQLLYNTEDQARKALQMIKSGKTVQQVAQNTDILNKNAISLGRVDRSSILSVAADEVFSLQAGETTSPIKSPFGWHLFHVSKIEPAGNASFNEVKQALEKDLRQRETDDALSALANKLEDALAGGSTIREAAKDLDLKIASLGPIDRQGRMQDGNASKTIPPYDKFLETAFKTEDKNDSQLITAKGGIFYLIHVDSITPERLRLLDEVKPQVIHSWQNEQRTERLAELAKTIAAGLATTKTRAETLAKYELQSTATGAIKSSSKTLGDVQLPPTLVAEVFASKPSEGTDAYAMKTGDYAVMVVNSIIPAVSPEKNPALKEAAAMLSHNLETAMQNEIAEQYTSYLSSKYPISVDEELIQRLSELNR